MAFQITPTQYDPQLNRYIPSQNEQGIELSREARFGEAIRNVFCPTGQGGGVDPTCSPKGSGSGALSAERNRAKLEEIHLRPVGVDAEAERARAKAHIARDLAAQLKRSDLFQEFEIEELEDLVGESVALWAETSGDHNSRALAMQKAAEKEFGLSSYNYPAGRESQLAEADDFLKDPNSEQTSREFLRAMYKHTQETIQAETGLGPDDEIVLYRGLRFYEDQPAPASLSNAPSEGSLDVFMKLQPMSSYSTDRDIAVYFTRTFEEGSYGLVISTRVKVRDILSTARTGYGCLTEAEVVVLGGDPKRSTVLERRERQ